MLRNGFTLIEVAAVMLLLGIAAACVALNLRGPMHNAQRKEVLDHLRTFDERTRQLARQQDKEFLVSIKMGRATLTRMESEQGRPQGEDLELPKEYRLNKVLMGQEEIQVGQTSLLVSRLGLSPSYALQIEDSAGKRSWLAFAGLTGRSIELEDEQTVRDILAARSRPDPR